jgi:HAD superfamily phosphoserine phosphatase-like hydrolase
MKKTAFCFDLDGTITKQEILPLIAKKVGIHEEISLLTDITLKGLIPFETSFKLRVKLLSTISIEVVKEVVSKVVLDDNIREFINNNKENCFVVTGNLNVWIKEFINKELGCKVFSSIANSDGDNLLGIESILNKGDSIKIVKKNFERVIAIGDSMNDCSMFEKADLGIAYGGVHNPVNTLVKMSDYVVYDSLALVRLLENIKYDN